MRVKPEYLLMFFAFILFYQIASPLLTPSYHLNIDSPAHVLRIWCLDQQGFAPSNWCPYINAGNPTSQYYYAPIDQAIVFLGKLFGLALVYNIAVALSLLSLGVGSYYLLKSRGYAIAPVIVLGMLALHRGSWHFAGFEQTVMVGMWHYILSIGFLLAACAAFTKFIEGPSKKNLIIAVLLTALFTHPMTLVVAVFFYGAIMLAYSKEVIKEWKSVAKFAGLSLAINMYYILPLATRLNLFIVQPSGGYFWTDIMQYVGQYIPWYLLVLGAMGCVTLYKTPQKAKPITAILIVLTLMFLVQFIDTPLRSRLPGIRTAAFLAPALYILVALGIEFLTYLLPKGIRPWAGISIGALLIFLTFTATAGNFTVLTWDHPAFASQKQLYEGMSQLPNGRVLVEETLYNVFTNEGPLPHAFTHSPSILPIVSGHELIGFGTYFFPKDQINFWNVDKGNLFGRKVEEWPPEELNKVLERYNMRYVISHNPQWTQYFAKIATPIAQVPPFYVFATNTSGSWYSLEAGTLDSENYAHFEGRATVTTSTPTILTQKTNWYPTWAATLDDQTVEVKDCAGFTCVDIPKGTHRVHFFQKLTKADWFGWIITVLGLIALFVVR